MEMTDKEFDAAVAAINTNDYLNRLFVVMKELAILQMTFSRIPLEGGVDLRIELGHRMTICIIAIAELATRIEDVFLSFCEKDRLRELMTTYSPGGIEIKVPPCFWGEHTPSCPHPQNG